MNVVVQVSFYHQTTYLLRHLTNHYNYSSLRKNAMALELSHVTQILPDPSTITIQLCILFNNKVHNVTFPCFLWCRCSVVPTGLDWDTFSSTTVQSTLQAATALKAYGFVITHDSVLSVSSWVNFLLYCDKSTEPIWWHKKQINNAWPRDSNVYVMAINSTACRINNRQQVLSSINP